MKIQLFIAFLLFGTNSICQSTIKIPLKTVVGLRMLAYINPCVIQKVDTLVKYKGIPAGYEYSRIGHIVFQREQYLYWKYKTNQITKQMLIDRMGNDIRDTLMLSNQPIRCYTVVFIGLKQNKKTIIVDTNGNDDFSDETEIQYDQDFSTIDYQTDSTLHLIPASKVKYEVFQNGKIHSRSKWLKVKPFDSSYGFGKDTLMQKIMVYGVGFEHKEGHFNIQNRKFRLIVNSTGFNKDNYKSFNVNLQRDSVEYSRFGFVKQGVVFE